MNQTTMPVTHGTRPFSPTPEDRRREAHISYHEIQPGIGCVCLAGRLDVRCVPQIEEVFEVMTASKHKSVIVDLSEVDLMNSVGLGMLISNANALRDDGARMVLLSPQPRVERVIRIACVDELLPIVYDVAEAVKRIKTA